MADQDRFELAAALEQIERELGDPQQLAWEHRHLPAVARVARERYGGDAQGGWQTGDPPKHGYYLAAWRRGERLTVSELWFNPDARPRWWFTRGYINEPQWGGRGGVDTEVVAWMRMPAAPPEGPASCE